MGFQHSGDYQEITVTSTEEIHQVIQDHKAYYALPRPIASKKEQSLTMFYRGQSDRDWDITSSLSRANVQEEELLEHTPLAMPKGMDLFGTIAYIQHYSPGTRFIDFTTDPNVAIYFACSGNEDKDGALYIYTYAPHKADWYSAMVLSELVRVQDDELTVQGFSEKLLEEYPELKARFPDTEDLNGAIVSFLDHGFMALPDNESYAFNLRMQRQRGCFYVCGVEFLEPLTSTARWFSRAGNNRFKPHSAVVPRELKNGHTLVKLIIPSYVKPALLQQLSLCGITEEFLLPDQ